MKFWALHLEAPLPPSFLTGLLLATLFQQNSFVVLLFSAVSGLSSVRRAMSSDPVLSAETNPRLVIGIVGEDGTADAMDVQGEAEEEAKDGGPLKCRKL